ncbi:MAG: T9SS type A sorting domain-containing protein [Bacteroidota bacterium]
MTKIKTNILLFLLLFLCCKITSFAQNRDCDPVIAKGASLFCVQGFAPNEIVGFRYEANNNWIQIPIQIDERILLDVSAPYGLDSGCGGTPKEDEPWDYLYYADSTSHIGADTDASFDFDDELLFMAKDVGERVDNVADPSGTANRCELEVYDPVVDSVLGYVYLFFQDGSLNPSAGIDYVDYDLEFFPMGNDTAGTTVRDDYIMCYNNKVRNTEASRVVTSKYESGFSARWTEDFLKLKTGNVANDNILDIHQITLDIDKCLRYTESFSTNRGVIVSTIDGPIRAIRSIMGANSGVYNQISIFFTECQAYYRSDFRVHDAINADVSRAYDMFDWSDVMNGAQYSNNYNPTPVTVDGNQDNLNNNELPIWSLFTGDQGSIVINASIVKNSDHYTFGATLQDVMNRTNRAGTAWDAYYDDAGDNASYTCTGDAKALGTSGWVVYTNQCYDYRFMTAKCDSLQSPNEAVFNRTNYYLPPNLSNETAARYGDYAQQPLQVLVLDIPLPVALVQFQAKKDKEGILLNWETATENDNAYFELERSTDGKFFSPIVQIKAHGTSIIAHQYTFLDVLPNDGINYYRLKQVDFSGTFEYSKVLSIEWKGDKENDHLKLFPNPAKGILYYLLDHQVSIELVRVYDAFGKLLKTVQSINGFLIIDELEKGMYVLEVQSNSGSWRKRFFKF